MGWPAVLAGVYIVVVLGAGVAVLRFTDKKVSKW